jgi:hypothetical protein
MPIICLFFGIIVGLLAKRKNRNPWLWGFGGALSWLIALLALAFLPYRCEAGTHDVTNAEGRKKICPTCDNESSSDPESALAKKSGDWSSSAPDISVTR